MSTKKTISADAITLLRQEIRMRTEIVRTIATLKEEVSFDRICGAWLSTENNLSVVIRRIGTCSYRLLLFDNTLCYKRLVQDAVIAPEQHTLLFRNADDPRDMNIVEYNAADEVLTLGCYGRFIAEDAVRRYDDGIAAEELPFAEEVCHE